MILTILFYILICFFGTLRGLTRVKRILAVCLITAVYTGLRWDYTPDYHSYEYLFKKFSSENYVYNPYTEHVEYGWYLLNRICTGFMGYFSFVFVTSCLFCMGVYQLMKLDTPRQYVWLVTLGIVTAGGFTTLLSAQRQMLVASLFMLSYRYCLYGRIKNLKSLLSVRCLVYFAVIWLASTFHRSALFLVIVPVLFILPKRNVLVAVGLVLAVVLTGVLGETVFVQFFQHYSQELDMYSYLKYNGDWNGSLTVLQGAMWAFMFYYTMKIYLTCDISRSEQASLLIAIMAILVTFAGFYLGQFGRVAHYMFMFTYLKYRYYSAIWRYVRKHYQAVLCHYPDAVACFRKEGYEGPVYMQTQVGVNTEWFHADPRARAEIRNKYNLGDSFVFGSASRFSSDKGLDDIIQALPGEGNWKFLMMGSGSDADMDRIRQAIEARGLQDRIILTGFVDWYEISKYWNAIDCGIHVPRTTEHWVETFSLSAIQPQATCKPVIGNTSGSVPYQIGFDEMTVPEGDIGALGRKIKWMMDNPHYAEEMGKKMYQRCIDSFSVAHLNDMFYDTLVEDVLTGHFDPNKADMTSYTPKKDA